MSLASEVRRSPPGDRSGQALAEFARAFPSLRYEVRVPTLDDLFLKLSLQP